MIKEMIRQNLVQADANLEYAGNAYQQAKVFYNKGELDKATFDKVCERAIQADIALCDIMIIASRNGYSADRIEAIIQKGRVSVNA